ncbi:MATE family efflux transporter [Ferrovibrio sp.]|uniref:MATE family efflux transporter n=1 Tax=Ferrovibrio sp. TaxID=1917215 RepID=UPI003D0DB2BA
MLLPEVRATLALALPIIGTQLAQMAIHTTDIMLLARYSESALAAAAVGMSLYYILWVMGMGLGMATPAIAAQALGRDANDREGVRHAVHDGLILVGIFCVLSMILLWFTEPLLLLTGQAPALAAEAAPFVRALSLSFLPSLWFMVLRHFTAALERPRPAMLLTIAAVALNLLVNYALVFGRFGLPEMGAVGAGLGSTLVNLATLVAIGALLARDPGFAAYSLSRGWWRSSWPRLYAYLRIGVPIALTLGAEVGLFSAAAMLMGRLGAAEVAAHQIALQWAAIAFMVPMGISQAATVRVGLAIGAGDAIGARLAGRIAFVLAIGFMACTGLTYWHAAPELIAAFLPDRTSQVHLLAVAYLSWAALFSTMDGAQAVANGALRGLKDTAMPMLLASIGYWVVGLPVAIGFGFYTEMRGSGIWLGLTASLIAVAVMLSWRFETRIARLIAR